MRPSRSPVLTMIRRLAVESSMIHALPPARYATCAGDVQRREGGLRADHHDLWQGFVQGDGLHRRFADLSIVFENSSVGNFFQSVRHQLGRVLFRLRGEFHCARSVVQKG